MTKTIYCIFLFVMMVLSPAHADRFTVKVNPSSPTVNESFDLIFDIELTENVDAKVFFNPSRAKILSENRNKISVNATVINGKVSVKRVMGHVYTLETDRPGLLVIKDIKVKIGKKTLKHNNIRINIGRNSGARNKSIFLLTVPSKTTVYLGEGLNVNYYLYYRVPLLEQVTDFFPKLNGFFKRTPLNITSREETVEYQGMVYKRVLLYSYRLYPEKTGTLKIDSFGVEVGYLHSRNRRTGSFWRLGGGVKRTKKLRSKKVPIEVLPLPAENVPNNFLGLIGEHDFKISVNKDKFLVNEAVEVRLEVTGPGALEQLAAPSIYSNERLEAFDVKSSIVELAGDKAKKTFDYTFLTRGHLNIEPRDLKVHLFDPDKDQYFEKIISIPGISVLGGVVQETEKQPLSETRESAPDATGEDDSLANVPKRVLLAPVFSPGLSDFAFPWLDYLNIILSLLIIFFPCCWLFERYMDGRKNDIHYLMRDFSKGKLEYAKVHRFLSLLSEDKEHGDIEFTIKNSALSQEAKNYFVELLEGIAENQYGEKGGKSRGSFNSLHFKEVCQLLSQKS